ncbi:DeSI-like protein At4g17486 [Durusdinium trenchii]|uniref:DeSI-like protein At4g17486 n=1 Tax=Durusdinium trenchii TaxID=1381693 RepID=A0ABP0QXH2_9DINO
MNTRNEQMAKKILKRRQQLAFGSLEVNVEQTQPAEDEEGPPQESCEKQKCDADRPHMSFIAGSDPETCDASDPTSDACEAQQFDIYTPRFLIHTPRSPKELKTLPKRRRRGHRVRLHIYDVSHEPVVQHLNQFLAYKDAPVKLGGIFHAGIEINKMEWSFGSGMESEISQTGVKSSVPTQNPQHNFRQTVYLGRTTLTREEISMTLANMAEEYSAEGYDLLRRNCCHFADDLCRRIGVKRPPRWLLRLAKIGAAVDEVLPEAVRDALPW